MQVSKQIKWGVFLTYIQMFLSAIISLFCTPIIINLLGKSEHGLYNLASSIISYLSLFSLGFGASYIRFYSRYKKNNDEDGIKKLNGLFLTVFIILGLIVAVAGTILINNVEVLFNSTYSQADLNLARKLMIFLTFNMALSFPMSVFQSYISSQERFIFQKTLNLFKTILSPILNIVLLFLGFGSIGMVLVTTVIAIAVDIINIFYCFKKLNFKVKFGRIDFKLLKEIFAFSLFLAINLLVDQINGQTDKLILGKMISATAVSIYAVADTIRHLYVTLSTSISSVFVPTVHRIVNSNKDAKEIDENLTNLFIKIGRIQYFILALVLTGFIFFGYRFIVLWVGSDYSITYYMILLLIIPSTVPLIQNIAIEVQRAKNKHKFRSLVFLGIAICNLVISIFLCKVMGIIGVVLGTLIANILGQIITMNIYYHKKLGLNIIKFWKEICKASLGFIVPIIVGLLFTLFVNFNSIIVYFACIAIYSIVYLISIYLLSFNTEEKSFVNKIFLSVKKIILKIMRFIGMHKLKLFLQKVYYFIISSFFCKKQVLFISFNGKQYSDNPKAISDYLIKNYPDLKQVWLLNNPEKYNSLPKNIKCKRFSKFSLLHNIASSRVVVDNDCLVYNSKLAKMPKTKKQLFIQTWHGDMGFKKCFYSVKDFKPHNPFTLEKEGFFDYFITGSKFAEPLVREMFKYNGKLLKVGCPRNDILLKDYTAKSNKSKEILNLNKETKILLYAPTFRENISEDNERIDFEKIIKYLEEKTKEKWVVVFRAHHFKDYDCNEKFLDGKKNFDDMADLMVASDMLITDYSSCAGDYAHLNKPIILYIDDYDDYKNNDRGLHFDIEKSPFMFAKTNEELLNIIKGLSNNKVEKNCKDILNFYQCYEDGNACKEVSKIIINHINKE